LRQVKNRRSHEQVKASVYVRWIAFSDGGLDRFGSYNQTSCTIGGLIAEFPCPQR